MYNLYVSYFVEDENIDSFYDQLCVQGDRIFEQSFGKNRDIQYSFPTKDKLESAFLECESYYLTESLVATYHKDNDEIKLPMEYKTRGYLALEESEEWIENNIKQI